MARRFSRGTDSDPYDDVRAAIARRRWLAALLAGTGFALGARAQQAPNGAAGHALIDDAQRSVSLASVPDRVFPAGPPASVFVYCLAPHKLLGWSRRVRPDEAAFLLPEVAARPELGRLTGRGSTAALEALLALRTQLIVDVGSVAPTYASLAEQVKRQPGSPYLLYDGAFDRTEETLRRLGHALGETARAESLARGVRAILDSAAEIRSR